jgi:hypothetical protein
VKTDVAWHLVGGETIEVPDRLFGKVKRRRSLAGLNDLDRGILVGTMREQRHRDTLTLKSFRLWRWRIEVLSYEILSEDGCEAFVSIRELTTAESPLRLMRETVERVGWVVRVRRFVRLLEEGT